MNLCNVPEDVLVKQVAIETIPDVSLLLLLTLATTIVVLTQYKWSRYLETKELLLAYVGMLVVFIPCWIHASHILVRVVTCLSNPQYAAMLKFAQSCAK